MSSSRLQWSQAASEGSVVCVPTNRQCRLCRLLHADLCYHWVRAGVQQLLLVSGEVIYSV